MDDSYMKHSNLPYVKKDKPIGLFDIKIHALPSGYKYDLKNREPISPNSWNGENSLNAVHWLLHP